MSASGREEPAVRGEHVTEDEAALYDRQIRLWGLEAQTRIRKAHILVINLDGLTTEAIKNWVLAGIAKLTLVDARPTVEAHDLSAGFFWRQEDVGGERLPPAAARIQALNPLVEINVLPMSAMEEIARPASSRIDELAPNVVLVGVPSGPSSLAPQWSKTWLCALNDQCRSINVPFYALGSHGLGGWAFSDLGDKHDYVVERPDVNAALPKTTVEGALHNGKSAGTINGAASTESQGNGDVQPPPAPSTSGKRLEKRRQAFVPLSIAAEYSWAGQTRQQLRRTRPVPGLIAQLALWSMPPSEQLPSALDFAAAMRSTIESRGLTEEIVLAKRADTGEPPATLEAYAAEFIDGALRHAGEFSPVCAMLGGVVSQDVLNALGGREEPFVNWFQLDGLQGAGPVFALGTPPHTLA